MISWWRGRSRVTTTTFDCVDLAGAERPDKTGKPDRDAWTVLTAAMKGEELPDGGGGETAAYAKALMFAASAVYLLVNLYAFGSAKQKLAEEDGG